VSEPSFHVVLNEEDQYSIWSTARPIPAGWRSDGFSGTKADCLDHIERTWTDMRPKSVRSVTPPFRTGGHTGAGL
jgi:MbtH protein